MTSYFLTEDDVRFLRELKRDYQGRREQTNVSRLDFDIYDEGNQAPETYVALVPVGGIPAATPAVGTGGLGFANGDQPGVADCQIFQPVGRPPSLEYIGKSQPVLNLSATAITQQWVTITREKFGRWIAQTGSGGCDLRNEQWVINMIGAPVGGSFSLTFSVGGTSDSIAIDYDSTAAEVKTAFATHSEIAASDINTTGGPLPNTTVAVEFVGSLAETPIGLPTVNKSGLSITPGTGTTGDVEGIGVVIARWAPGFGG